jgi:hypothetical protein
VSFKILLKLNRFPCVGPAWTSPPLAWSVGGRSNAPQRLPFARRVRGRHAFSSSLWTKGYLFKKRGFPPAACGPLIRYFGPGASAEERERVGRGVGKKRRREGVAGGAAEKVPSPGPFSLGKKGGLF